MTRYLIRRILSGALIFFLFITIVFFASQIILPGDYVSQFYGLSLEGKETLRLQLGLNLPIWQRYFVWLGDLLRGDLGTSFSVRGTGAPVAEIIAGIVPPTVLVFGLGTALAFLLGTWLGQQTAWQTIPALSGSAVFSSIMLYTAFPPWLGFLLSYLLVTRFKLLPGAGLWSADVWYHAPLNRQRIMWLMVLTLLVVVILLVGVNALVRKIFRRPIPVVIFVPLAAAVWGASWYVGGFGLYALDVMKQAFLPTLTFTLLSFGEIMLIMRSNMIDTLHEDYITTAVAKGLSRREVRNRHAARNALLPVLSRLVISLPYLLTGVVMIEYTLDWEGLGSAIFYAFGRQNITLAIGLTVVVALISLVARLFLDVIVILLDPRIRHSARTGTI